MDYIRIGFVQKPQGIKGELKVEMLTDYPERFSDLKRVYIESGNAYESIGVRSAKVRSDAVYMMFEGICERNGAEALRGKYICVTRDEAVKLPEGRYFISDLIGCEVYDDLGNLLGVLQDVLHTGPVDIYSIKGHKSFMAPAIKSLLISVDIQAKRIVLDAKNLEEVVLWE